MRKAFITANVRDIIDPWMREEITFSRMVELFNEVSENFNAPNNPYKTFLFLDDIRDPADAYGYTNQSMFLNQIWDVVRSFDEFKRYIENSEMPDFISFDHDLADTHYVPEHLWNDHEASKEWQEKQIHKEKTGYECALWLIDYCMDNNITLPDYYCHSMNPIGKEKILGVLKNFVMNWKKD